MEGISISELQRALKPGERFETAMGGLCVLKHVRAGRVALPTGRIVMGDPWLINEDHAPFRREVEPGEYDVDLVIACFENGSEHVALSIVRFSGAEPGEWRGAPTTDRSADDERVRIGFAVDNGAGAVMDASAAPVLGGLHGWPPTPFEEQVRAAMEANRNSGAEWACVSIDEARGLNMVVFSTGHGDGIYPSVFGLDGEGRAVCLVSLLGVL